MKIAIIIDNGTNESLLRFTETKLFFDAKNVSRNFVNDCVVVSSTDQAQSIIDTDPQHTYFVIPTGAFLTTGFCRKHKDATGAIWVDLSDDLVIPYDADTYVGGKKRCKYPERSKQLYIVENMLKSIIAAKRNVYIENTETSKLITDVSSVKHLYGLASGWKTAYLAYQIGLSNLESITVYDTNPYQLEWAKNLHSFKKLPDTLDVPHNRVGEYNVPDWANDWWHNWHQYPVQFKSIDLLSAPEFPDNSLVWISNVFNFEPLIFNLGWKKLKTHKEDLLNANKKSIIIEI